VDIRKAFKTCCYMGQYGNRENVYLLSWFDMNANPVEVLYTENSFDPGPNLLKM